MQLIDLRAPNSTLRLSENHQFLKTVNRTTGGTASTYIQRNTLYNPLSQFCAWVAEKSGEMKRRVKPWPVEHINRQIPPEPHTPMYVWHKYWSRKTWNVVGEFIRTYSKAGEVVFDPFAGAGVVGIEAVRNGRKAIICDLNPTACLIAELTVRPVDLVALKDAYERVQRNVKNKIEKLYEIHCVKCKKTLIAECFVREGDRPSEVRYPNCPHCGYRAIGDRPSEEDVEQLERLESRTIREWYPSNKLCYEDGTPFLKREHYDSLDQLFTHRNLQGVAWIYEAINDEKSPLIKKFLMGAFTSMIHLCTRMMPVGNPQPSNHYTYFSSPGWTQHSYWSAPRFMEQNVWLKFESAVVGHQGLMNAKEESHRVLGQPQVTTDWQKVLRGKADLAIVTGDCLELMDAIPESAVNYIFTDPPYDSAVQYGELSLLWNAWIHKDANYGEFLRTHEIIHNERQGKGFDAYSGLLAESFRKCHRVLRSGRYLTLTFHNPTFKVRNETVRAGVFAGFDYQKIHHQPLGQVSPKAMLQPFGSAQGDFYLRFYKPKTTTAKSMEEVSEERFRRIVIDTCKQVIAERAEPTPYTILVNYIDPVLAKRGLFATLKTGLDIKKVLEQSEGKEFKLVESRIGSAAGKLWWFNDPTFVARLKEVPLSERVEQTVYRLLYEKGKVTFTAVWDSVSREFPNSLTTDTTSIREALEAYGQRVGQGYWMLRDEVRRRVRSHAEMIALLAMIGRKRGFDIWIGKPEQGAVADGIADGTRLSALVTKRPTKISGVSNLRDVLLMDLLWMKGDEVETAFEVECTTTMTSALQRASNLSLAVPKVMVLPEERQSDFNRKMASPLFRESFTAHNWNLLFFDKFREAFLRTKDSTNIESLLGVSASSGPEKKKTENGNQPSLPFTDVVATVEESGKAE